MGGYVLRHCFTSIIVVCGNIPEHFFGKIHRIRLADRNAKKVLSNIKSEREITLVTNTL